MISKYAKKQLGKRTCHRKVQYYTRKKAWEMALYFFTKFGSFETCYKCKYCELYHLTKKGASPNVPPEYIEGLAKWFQIPLEEFKKILK